MAATKAVDFIVEQPGLPPMALTITLIDLGRSIFLWCGPTASLPALGALFAAVPGGAPSGGALPLPASSTQLLDAGAACDEDAASSLSRALSMRSGKQVLLSLNVAGLGEGAALEAERRCLEVVGRA